MAKKPTYSPVTDREANASEINAALDAINEGFTNTVSRDGSTPNTMDSDFDLNSNDLLNVRVTNTSTLKLAGETVSPSELVISAVEFKKEFTTVTTLLADTDTYTVYAENDYLRVLEGNFVYKVANSSATDEHLTTAGGVKLYDLQGRNAKAAEVAASLPDGSIVTLDGLPYQADSSATGTNSATNDLGVDGLVPFEAPFAEHFGARQTSDDTTALRSLIAYMMVTESDGYLKPGETYTITGELDVPKEHSGVVRRYITLDGHGAKIVASGTDFTMLGYTKVLTGPLDITNYFLRFRNISFKATQGNNIKAIRWGGFVSSEYENLHFEDVDYPFWQEPNDPRGTPNYVQSPIIRGCYSNGHKRFITASVVYNGDLGKSGRNIIDVGDEAIRIDRGATAQSFYQLGIANNVIQSHSGRAVLLGGGQALDYSSNYHENNAHDVLLVGTTVQTDGDPVAEVGEGVYWEYITAQTAWSPSEYLATSGVYRTNAGNIYRLVGIGQGGSTAPTHTSGTVSDGGVYWEFIGSYGTWVTATSYTTGDFTQHSTRIYRAATDGTSGATAPVHVQGTVHNYGGAIRDNFTQPKGTPATGYRAFIELAECPEFGFSLGGNVAQGGDNYYFSRFANGYFNTLGDRDALTKERLYDPDTRPDSEKALFQDGARLGVVHGDDGGVVLNPEVRGYEITHAELDWYDSTDNKRVPVVHGVAESAPPGFGPVGAFPPSIYSTIYAQKGWTQGSILWNNTLNAGEPLGWVCVVSGRPGTWAPFGGVQTANAYSPSNYTPNRTLNAGTATTGVLANVLATLIGDLQGSGVLK